MIPIEKRWDESLLRLNYGDGYDIRIHAVQVALCLLSRRSQLSQLRDLNSSLVRFGYYDVETENSISSYQYAVGLPTSKKLDKVTYESLFEIIRKELNSIIVQVAEDKLKIQEITKDMLDDEYDSNNDDAILNSDSEYDTNNFPSSDDLYYQDNQVGSNSNNINDNKEFIDNFWNSMSGEYDSIFLSTTVSDKSFGSGGRLNLNGGRTYITSGELTKSYNETSNLESSYIDTLLSNSIYSGNFDYVKPSMWVSNSSMNINVSGYTYENSEKHKTFFSENNSDTTRKSNYDITIVYGANGQFAKKLLGVVHRAKTQQVDASGEAIFDIIEFIAKDIVETTNTRK